MDEARLTDDGTGIPQTQEDISSPPRLTKHGQRGRGTWLPSLPFPTPSTPPPDVCDSGHATSFSRLDLTKAYRRI